MTNVTKSDVGVDIVDNRKRPHSALVSKAAARRYWKTLFYGLVNKKVNGPKYTNVNISLSTALQDLLKGESFKRVIRVNENMSESHSPKITVTSKETVIRWNCTIGEIRLTLKESDGEVYASKYRLPVILHRLIETKYATVSDFLEELIFDAETTLERIVEDNALNGALVFTACAAAVVTIIAIAT